LSVEQVSVLPGIRVTPGRRFAVPGDVVVGIALLGLALIVGLATAQHYGFTTDEFNTDDYGPKALAWYLSLGADRSHFETVEPYLWYYGPWHQILTAIVQSAQIADPVTVRHAMTFLAGLAGIAFLLPIARLSVGRWAGPVAVLLCLTTGYFYGSLFFTPIDVPFLAAMTGATWAILLMASRDVPAWPATVAAGLLTGLAMATRTAGIITHVYLIGAVSLCALEVAVRRRHDAMPLIIQIGIRTAIAILIAWSVAIALWPWLQIGNPFRQFATAHLHFTHNAMSFELQHWGEAVRTDELPFTYIPAQLLARLPEGFLLLLVFGAGLAVVTATRLMRASVRRFRGLGWSGLAAPALVLATSRASLLVIAAALVPVAYVMMTHATHYDGIRHVLFIIPMLAVLAGRACIKLVELLRLIPALAIGVAAVAAAHICALLLAMAQLHPLEYVAMNSLAGGTKGAAGRFELDYWGAAATEAVRQLEQRVDGDPRFLAKPPRVLVCLIQRQGAADRLFRRNWIVETEPAQADFIIDTERWPCGKEVNAILIDEVKRLDVSFARVYALNSGATR
jgi:hypothetical protein